MKCSFISGKTFDRKNRVDIKEKIIDRGFKKRDPQDENIIM